MYKHTRQFVDYCIQTLEFDKQISYDYQSLSICIVDCVYSLRALYYDSTIPVVNRYAARYLGGNASAPTERVSDLIQHITEAGGPTPFAANILKNNQLSGRILKAEVCLNLAKYLKYLHVETMEDFKRFEFPELLETVIHSVKGMGDAGTNYLFMLAGDPNRCKPDVHIHHCIKDACGEDISNDDCQLLFSEAVQELKRDYPYLTVAKLDGIIWRKYQGAKHKKSK